MDRVTKDIEEKVRRAVEREIRRIAPQPPGVQTHEAVPRGEMWLVEKGQLKARIVGI